MTSATGAHPPLHRRYNEAEALQQIRNRYDGCRRKIPAKQIAMLQKSQEFVAQTRRLYELGYKDSMIVVIIYNIIMNRHLAEAGVNLLNQSEAVGAMREFVARRIRKTYPVGAFLGAGFERARITFLSTVLITWGFHPRLQVVEPAVIEAFLRHRMRFFELDFPHDPLFDSPPGDWPAIE